MRFVKPVLCLLSLVALSGCATILTGGRTELEIAVQGGPDDTVAIRVNGIENGQRDVYYAPRARHSLDRASAYMVIAEAPGYHAAVATIHKRLSAWLIGDVLLGAPLVLLGWPLNVRPFPGGPDLLSFAGGGVAVVALGMDLMTGRAWVHDQDQVRLRLEKEPVGR